MSGHSQFANIKHRKDAQDSKRGKIFQKISREIYIAVKLYGSNVDNNSKLRAILEKARSLNMPKDNITRAIKKANSQGDTTNYEVVIYEGYSSSSIAIIVHCLTDNKNRTASNIRSYFNKCNGKLATTNSVQYLFFKAGVLEFTTKLSLDQILELVIDFEVQELTKNDDIVHLEVSVKDLLNVADALANAGIKIFIVNEVRNIPINYISPEDVNNDDELNLYQKLLDLLENDEDVQLVETNLKG
ncbi:MAG: YebC/PmpR family DNA-binding transcriptional regulator [Spiroplasma sp.]